MENMKELIKAIKNKMADLPSLTEENIKNHIVVNLFLKEMGYDPDKWDYECRISNGRADLVYKENGKPLLIVETKGLRLQEKNQSIDITDNDIDQISNYLNKQQDGIVWGILTNGKRYILLNGTIEGILKNRIVFDISIENTTDQYYLKYFSYRTIFETKTTNFFADIARFRNWFKGKSWRNYKGTLYNFFDYYSENHQYRVLGNDDRDCLTKISIDDFISFIEDRRKNNNSNNGRAVNSPDTIENYYSHISVYFKTLKVNHYIDHHDFEYDKKDFIKIFNENPRMKSENYMSADKFSKALDFLYKKQKTGTRDSLIFLLCAYYGFERSEVSDLKWENIDFDHSNIIFHNRYNPMPDLVIKLFKDLLSERKLLKSSQEYVITTIDKQGKRSRLKQASEATINSIFSSLKSINKDDSRWALFTPKYVRQCLVQNMFANGFSIEQIVAYTGVDILQITNYIPKDKIISEGNKRLLDNRYKQKNSSKVEHPYAKEVNSFIKRIST